MPDLPVRPIRYLSEIVLKIPRFRVPFPAIVNSTSAGKYLLEIALCSFPILIVLVSKHELTKADCFRNTTSLADFQSNLYFGKSTSLTNASS